MARSRDVVIDSRHPASLARFSAEVLDGYAVAPYDEAELESARRRLTWASEVSPPRARGRSRTTDQANTRS